MNLDNPESKVTPVDSKATVRRTFLKRATAGAIVTSIPGKSAWANIQGSIVASGQGSDTGQSGCLQVLSPGYWKNHSQYVGSATFLSIFGGEPLSKAGVYTKPGGSSYTMLEVLQSPGGGGNANGHLGGESNVNYFLVSTYLNCLYDGQILSGNNEPVVFPAASGLGASYGSAKAMAEALYNDAKSSSSTAKNIGSMLSAIVDSFHLDNDIVVSESSTVAGGTLSCS